MNKYWYSLNVNSMVWDVGTDLKVRPDTVDVSPSIICNSHKFGFNHFNNFVKMIDPKTSLINLIRLFSFIWIKITFDLNVSLSLMNYNCFFLAFGSITNNRIFDRLRSHSNTIVIVSLNEHWFLRNVEQLFAFGCNIPQKEKNTERYG